MFDYEENAKRLNTLKIKLKDLGDSLWHFKFRKRIKNIRRTNSNTKFLEWFKKF